MTTAPKKRRAKLVNIYIVLGYALLGYMRHSIFGPFDKPRRKPKLDPIDFDGHGSQPVPTAARPGSQEKVDEMARRYRLRQELFCSGDPRVTNATD